MKKSNLINQISIIFTFAFLLIFITGCDNNSVTFKDLTDAQNITSVDLKAPYFKKGVYLNYEIERKNPPKDYFYVFYDEVSGHTDDGSIGMGLPFECEQKKGVIKFSFGGVGPEGEDFLTIESAENGNVTGHFKDGKKLIFVFLPNVNPDNFDAEKYLKNLKKQK